MQIMKFYKISFLLNKLQNIHIIKQEEWKEAGLMLYTKNSWNYFLKKEKLKKLSIKVFVSVIINP